MSMKLPKGIEYHETGPEWDTFEEIVRYCAKQARIWDSEPLSGYSISEIILKEFGLKDRCS